MMTHYLPQLVSRKKNVETVITFKGITLFCGVEPRDAIGIGRAVTGNEREEILTHLTLHEEQHDNYETSVMEIHRVNGKIYSITYRNNSEPYVEELQRYETM